MKLSISCQKLLDIEVHFRHLGQVILTGSLTCLSYVLFPDDYQLGERNISSDLCRKYQVEKVYCKYNFYFLHFTFLDNAISFEMFFLKTSLK